MFKKIKNYFNNHIYLKTFIFIYCLAFICFMIPALENGFRLPMNGDYILQTLHFYCEGRDAFLEMLKTGELQMWSYEGFLGVNYFAANTFYYITSIFSLPVFLVPKAFIPQMIFLMFLFKIALGGTLFFHLMRKYFKCSDKTSLIGGIAYALCGWGMYYLWFNHFHDVFALFPLMFIGVEEVIQNKKGWILTIAIFLMGCANYYFLFNFIILIFLYAVCRYFMCFKQNKHHNAEVLSKGVGFAILGLGMCAFVLLPSAFIVVDTPRVETSSLLLEFLGFFFVNPIKNDSGLILGPMKGIKEIFDASNMSGLFKYMFVFKDDTFKSLFYPLSSFLFPPVNNWDTALFKNSYYDNIISSTYISIPLMLLIIPRFIELIKEKKIFSIIVCILFSLLPFIPFTYYFLNAFSQEYGRWFLFLSTVLLIFVIPLLDRYDTIDKLSFDISLLICLVLMSITIFIAYTTEGNNPMYDNRYLIVIGIILYTLVCWFLLRENFNGANVKNRMYILVILDLVVCSQFALFGQGYVDYYSLYGGYDHLKEQRKIFADLDKKDDSFYRVFNTLANRNANNIGMTLGYKSMSTFHSVYNFNLTEFINDWSKINYTNGNWSMSYDEKRADLDAFFGVKYYVEDKDNLNIPWNYELDKEYEFYNVYKNTDYQELGFAFDSYINKEVFDDEISYYHKDPYYTTSAILSEEDAKEVNEEIHLEENENLYNTYQYFNYSNNMTFTLRGEEPVKISSYSEIKDLVEDRSPNTLYGPWVIKNLAGDKITMNLNKPLCPSASEDNIHHVLFRLCYGPNVRITFYDKDNNVIVSDDHGTNNYNHDGDHKYVRGFYLNRPAYKIELEMLRDCKYSTLFRYGMNIEYTSELAYETRMNKLKPYKFNNIKVSNNHIDFDTDYNEDKFIVLNVPYDEGWSLKVNDEEQKIYKAQSGFIGFIAKNGANHYHLDYFTPKLKLGLAVSIPSTIIFMCVTLIPFTIRKRKKKKAANQ